MFGRMSEDGWSRLAHGADALFEDPDGAQVPSAPPPARPGAPTNPTPARSAHLTTPAQGVFDPTFPARVAVLLRSRPITDAASGADRQDWPEDTYDVPTLALAAIDLVIAQQGFEHEATYEEVLGGLTSIAGRSAPIRAADEHARVAAFVLDSLLNRAEREAPFTYRISDYTDPGGHQQRQVQFRLLVEREDPVRGDVVLNATGDAINALVGGLEFDVEDEQAANEFLLERQLARGAFESAEGGAHRARALSVRLASELTELLKATRRDLRSVLDDWKAMDGRFDDAREHIRGRIDIEHRLLGKVRETLTAADPDIAAASARIASLLEETQRRHEALHRQVITARSVFLEEQNRQSFRPPVTGYLPDLTVEVLRPLLAASTGTAEAVTQAWLSDVSGPCVPRLPRLYRLVNDLWNLREVDADRQVEQETDEAGEPDPPVLRPAAIDAAVRAVQVTGLPARLSALIVACLGDTTLTGPDRQQAAEIVTLAALWAYAPESADPDQPGGLDLTSHVLGERATSDTDGTVLDLPGWDGDDLVIAADENSLAVANPRPVTQAAPAPRRASSC